MRQIFVPPVTQLLRSKCLISSLGAVREKNESFGPEKSGQILFQPIYFQILIKFTLNLTQRVMGSVVIFKNHDAIIEFSKPKKCIQRLYYIILYYIILYYIILHYIILYYIILYYIILYYIILYYIILYYIILYYIILYYIILYYIILYYIILYYIILYYIILYYTM